VTSKADFNAEDWSTVVDGPLYAGIRVIAADRGGTLRESVAMSRVYQDARAHHGSSTLLDELLKSPPTIDAKSVQSAGGDIGAVTTDHLRRAMSVLDRVATQEEADAYKTFVMTVAQAVAGAHKEGGFLGVGGTAVSEAEEQALDEISAALGTPPASATPS
jgi:hypothetical protein